METKNTQYMPDLDVLRALAAVTVFVWHYIHFQYLIPETAYIPGLALFEEGHVGVSLFMVLSGYLFVRITFGKNVNWNSFAWNRMVRIAPLLILTQVAWLAAGLLGVIDYGLSGIAQGFVLPTWTGGAWSIAVELHFYLLLPLILWALSGHAHRMIWIIATLAILRLAIPLPQELQYLTILGRIDQFLIGGALALYLHRIPAWLGGLTFAGFLLYLEAFNYGGGHALLNTNTNTIIPSNTPVMLIEGIGFAGLFAMVMNSNWKIKETKLWAALGWIGKISYSVYLWHFFLILAWFFVLNQTNLTQEVRLALIIPCFALLLAGSAISYYFIEMRFLRSRVRYIGNINAPEEAKP